MTAVPPGSSPAKISPLASAMASRSETARVDGSTVVTMAICGRTIASTVVVAGMVHADLEDADRVSAGMRASVSGTPQWLLNDLSEACTLQRRQPCAASPSCWSCRRDRSPR